MFPNENVNELRKARAVLIDPIQSISALLVRNDIVGNKLQHFKWKYENKQSISNANTGDWWKNAELHCEHLYGDHVHLLPLIFSSDKTELTKFGKIVHKI